MRKLLPIGFVAFILVLTAALSISWFIRSAAVKKDVEAYIASFTTENFEITYEEVTVSGFPSTMNVTIVKPHFTGRMDKFIKELGIEKLLKLQNIPEWSEDYTLNGNIDLNVNIFSNKFKIEVSGDFVEKGNISGKTIAVNSQSSGDSVCELQIKNTNWLLGNLWNLYSLSNNSNKFFQDFRSLDCVIPEGKLTKGETNEPILSYGGSRIFISRTPEKDISNIRFYAQASDIEATKAYDNIYIIYQQALAPSKNPVMPSIYGKQNIEIDLSYNGTENWKSPDAKNMPLNIKIDRLFVSNNAYHIDTSLSLTNSIKDNIRNVALSYKTEAQATDLLRAILMAELRTMKDSIIFNTISSTKETKEKLSSLSPENLDKIIDSVTPDFVSLDKMLLAIDANYSGDEKFESYEANLNSFEISATPYGLSATGSVKRNKNSIVPSGNLSLSCNNCMNLIDDIVNYLNNAKNILVIFSPKTSDKINIPPETIKSIKDFMLALIPDEASNDKNNLKFNFVNDEKGSISINGKNTAELFEIYNKINPQQLKNNTIVPVPAPAPKK